MTRNITGNAPASSPSDVLIRSEHMGGLEPDTAHFADTIVAASETARIGIVIWAVRDGEQKAVFVNEAATKMLERTKEELLESPTAAHEALDALSIRSAPPGISLQSGRRRFEVRRRAVDHPDGRAEVAFLFDVSDRREAEARLAASFAAFRAVLDVAPDAIAIGTKRRLLYVNPALAALLGEPAARIIEHPVTDYVEPTYAARTLDVIDKLWKGEPTPNVPLVLRAVDGSSIPVELSAMLIDWGGERALLAAGREVSARTRAQTELAGADRLAAIGTLTAGIAHEVNNPLAYVLLNLQYLIRKVHRYDGSDAMTASLIERLGEAQHGTRRVGRIVADLRTLARSDEKSVGPIHVEDALRSAVRIAASTLRDRARLEERYAPVPPVDANATKLEQVFVNLLVNAGQAIEGGSPNDQVVSVEVKREGREVIVTVSDTGSGIPPHTLRRIFDPFFTTKPRGMGTGLGLPISYQIVSAFGGTLTVDSEVGRGTTFRVALPISKRAGTLEPRTPTPPPMPAFLQRAAVLVIDDEPLVTDMLARVFGENHDVTVTTSPSEGLALILEHDYDVVFCDLLMPGLSGMDIYDELAKRKPGAERRIVFMTGGAFTERAAEFLTRVDNRRIVKPFEISDLERALANVALRGAK